MSSYFEINKSRKGFVIAVDESGENAPVFDPKRMDFRYNIDKPVAMLFLLGIRRAELEPLAHDWDLVRGKIKDELGLDSLPPIHMRLMWGKKLNEKAPRLGRNPYVDASQEQIYKWVKLLLEVWHKYGRRRGAFKVEVASIDVKGHGKNWAYFMGDMSDWETLKQRIGRKAFSGFTNALTNPYLHLLYDAIYGAASLFRTSKHSTLILDESSHASGFDTTAMIQYLLQNGYLGSIDNVYMVNNGEITYEDCIAVQIADFYGYLKLKKELHDPVAQELLGHETPQAYMKRKASIGPPMPPPRDASLLFRYELGYRRAVANNPNAKDYLLNPREYAEALMNVREENKLPIATHYIFVHPFKWKKRLEVRIMHI